MSSPHAHHFPEFPNTCERNLEEAILFSVVGRSTMYIVEDDNPPQPLRGLWRLFTLFIESVVI